MSELKKFSVYTKITGSIITFMIIIFIVELASLLTVSYFKKSYSVDPDITEDLLLAIERMNHVRHFEANVDYDSISSLVFNRNLSPLSEKGENLPQLVIQGDSWAEQFLYSQSPQYRARLTDLESKMDVIYAGVSSFSPSLMSAQINWIKDHFKDFSPSIIVTIIDQTDFGDELCRYRNVRTKTTDGRITVAAFDATENEKQNVYIVKHNLRYSKILNSEAANFVKILQLAYYRITARLAPTKDCGWNKISQPLRQGLNDEDTSYMIEVLNDYLSTIETLGSVKTVILVTHPHHKHIAGEYILEMGAFIDDHLDLILNNIDPALNVVSLPIRPPKGAKLSEIDYFKKNDVASHLSDEAHSSYFIDAIIEKIDKQTDSVNLR